jgi:autophagy-related protein 9
LFKNKQPNNNTKVTIPDVLIPLKEAKLSSVEVCLIVFAVLFWVYKLVRVVHTVIVNLAIKSFYTEALHINDCSSFTWQDIQTRLIQAQHLCLIQDGQLNELVIHNRLLRHHNYMIALINKGLLPIHYKVPLLGEIIFFTEGLQFNFQRLLFKGSLSLFEHNWKLRDDVKNSNNRLVCAEKFRKHCVCLAIINIILFPLISIWQLLYTFYTYAEAIKRDPSMALGSRGWSLYAKWFCRHFNELDHQLNERVNRGYKAATKYMNSFTSPTFEIIARFVTFIAGTILSIFIILTIYDEDVITVEHLLTVMTGLGGIIAISRTFISSEIPSRYTHAELNAHVLEHIHYKPHGYAPYTIQARSAMSSVFQYKIIGVFEELISPLATPYILLRHLRPRALEIIDFFRNYTVEISGTGDVCTFAMMNIKEHGNPLWKINKINNKQDQNQIRIDDNLAQLQALSQQRVTENGKLELSLIHFKLTNPNWNPINDSQSQFINNVKTNCVIKEVENDDLMGSVGSVSSSSLRRKSLNSPNTPPPSNSSSVNRDQDIESDAYRNERERLLSSYSNCVSEHEERAAAMSMSTLFLHQYTSSNVFNSRLSETHQTEKDPLLTSEH